MQSVLYRFLDRVFLDRVLHRLRSRRGSHLFVVNLRILLGFAFLPAGLKKVLKQPFTEPQNTGAFHEFLHAFYATGAFYSFVGWVQLVLAVLLMTQTFALLGALMTLPVITCIVVFCWSTGVIPTATVTTLMLGGTLLLLAWDAERWLPLLDARFLERSAPPRGEALIDLSLWRVCGVGILVVYGLACWLHGGVYRPRGMDLHEPGFYVLPLIALFPVVTWGIERRRVG